MLRFTTARDLCTVFKWSTTTVSRLAKGQVNHIYLARSGICVQKVNFFTQSPYRREGFPNSHESDEPDTLDLDKWKDVMRLNAVQEKNIQVAVEDENEEEIRDDVTLQATRELVKLWRETGRKVPEEINDEELQHLRELTTMNARKSYLKSLARKEGFKLSKLKKQEIKKAARIALLEQEAKLKEDEGDDQNQMRSELFLRLHDRSQDMQMAWRCAQAMQFNQPLIFDLSYESNMSKRDIVNTARQLVFAESWNRRAPEPYHLHYCNLQPGSYTEQNLKKIYGAEFWDRLLITSTDKQHFQLFPREQLVYLSPDSRNVLKYDHNKVYIIGGMVDRTIRTGLSMANAKRFKLATARLPLDEFLDWNTGGKSLTLDQMLNIMLVLKENGTWEEALQFVPDRKHSGFYEHTNIRSTFNGPKT